MDTIEAEFDKVAAFKTISDWPEFAVMYKGEDALPVHLDWMVEQIVSIMEVAHTNEQIFRRQRAHKKIVVRGLLYQITAGSGGMSIVLLLALTGALGGFKWIVLALSLLPFVLWAVFPIIKLVRTGILDDESMEQFYEGDISAKTKIAAIRGIMQGYIDAEEVNSAPDAPNILH